MTDNKNWVFILNPIAGNGFVKKYEDTIKEKLNEFGVDADLVYTQKKGHASQIADVYAKKGYKHIISVGGDGTLNEVVRPLVGNKDVIVGIIPAGTGNDFIQILGFPNRFEDKHWPIFFEQNTMDLDVGTCNDNYFLNGMGLGFDAEVAAQNYEGEDIVKKGGKDKYIRHILKTLLFFKEKRMKFLSDNGNGYTDCFINTTSIGRRFAGGFFLTPEAIANDGLLDVCSIEKLSLFQRFRILPMVPKGTHIKDKNVTYYKTANLDLQFSEKVPYHLDGELFFDQKFDIGILPGALKIIYNPQGPHYFK
ncbi:MAG: diacylglycerol kinase family lipid kinase [Calditrichaceae bacterium]|nr:diacylglycerol kinase family lipid kinase [Calditrichaceae bacterium]